MIDPYIKLAKNTVETYVRTGKVVPLPDNLPKTMLSQRAGVFVSIHKRDGSLRGCIGTFKPTKKNIAQEIMANAITAAAHDPRFPSVTQKELPNLVFSVDILSKPQLVASCQSLDPKKYGIIIQTKDGRRALLLPDLEGVDTVAQQISICRQKAWIPENEPVKIYCFTVERHSEE